MRTRALWPMRYSRIYWYLDITFNFTEVYVLAVLVRFESARLYEVGKYDQLSEFLNGRVSVLIADAAHERFTAGC